MNPITRDMIESRFDICPECLDAYPDGVLAVYVVGCRDGLHLFLPRYTGLKALAFGDYVSYPSPAALCGQPLPGGYRAKFLAVSGLLASCHFITSLVKQHPDLAERPITAGVFEELGIDIDAELAAAALLR